MKKVGIIILLIMAVALCGCSEEQNDKSSFEQAQIDVQLGFDSFPRKYTCDGDDISPQIKISGINMENAESMAVIMEDPDANGFTHWVIWNVEPANTIPSGIPKQGEVSTPISAVQGKNSFGNIGYGGPCPPEGEEHTYTVEIFVVKKELDLSSGSTKQELKDELTGYVSQHGKATATYGR